jgi:transglutaminase-like putative cysteine protease
MTSQLDRVLRVAIAHGAAVIDGDGEVEVSGHTYRKASITVRDNTHAVSLLNALAESDAAEDEKIRDLGRMFRDMALSNGLSDEQLARRLLAFVQQTVTFAPEDGEKFRTPSLTLTMGAGDCDDSARLIAALAMATGMPARVVLEKNSRGEESHVVAQIWHNEAWHYAEGTFAAMYGEHPREAAQRLGLIRSDVA